MSRRLSPDGLAGAFARSKPASLDFLVPVKPAPQPVVEAPQPEPPELVAPVEPPADVEPEPAVVDPEPAPAVELEQFVHALERRALPRQSAPGVWSRRPRVRGFVTRRLDWVAGRVLARLLS